MGKLSAYGIQLQPRPSQINWGHSGLVIIIIKTNSNYIYKVSFLIYSQGLLEKVARENTLISYNNHYIKGSQCGVHVNSTGQGF